MMRPYSRFVVLWLAILAVSGCFEQTADPSAHGSAWIRLKPLTAPLPDGALRRAVYVPVYSSMYLGQNIRHNMVELAATVSVRNVSSRYPVVLLSARYYDSVGKQVREYLSGPSELGAMATVEFVIARSDTTGGPGANFLVQWAGPPDIDEPLIEAVMMGRSGSAGYSFTSPGRAVNEVAPK